MDDTALRDIEALRAELYSIIDTAIDALKQTVPGTRTEAAAPFEREYLFSTVPSLFKGKKPVAVMFGGDRVATKTWRQVYAEILRQCDAERHDALLLLRNRVAGRKRVVLSDKADGMSFPIKLSDGLFAEGDFDAEWLMRTLRRILDAAGYDYSGINIVIRER